MIWQGWLFIGVVGLIATYTALTTQQDDIAIMWGLIGVFSWALFSFQSLHVLVHAAGSSTPDSYSYAAVSVWGLALAIANAYVVLNGPIALVDQRGRANSEVTQ